MGRLILIRHGQTNKNISNMLHSSDDQESLNKVGVKQITLTAKKLATISINKIYPPSQKTTACDRG